MSEEIPLPADLESRRAQMFPALTDAQIARVAAVGVQKTFEAGEIVYEQGDENVPWYVVLEGEIVVVHPERNHENPIVVYRHGQFSGEVNLVVHRRTLVRARAKTRVRAIRVEPARLSALIQTDPELSEILMRAFILRRVGLLETGQGDVVVIGSRDSAPSVRLRSFLMHNGHPCRYVDVDQDPDVQTLLDDFHVGLQDIPILICRGERVLRNPSDSQVADCLGFNPVLDPGVVHDVVICGAGPGGLAAAVYGASEGLDVLIVEHAAPGGQAASSSKIENYLGFPTGISGQALAGRALTQAEKFGAELVVARGALKIHGEETPLRIEIEGGQSVRALAVIIATGAEYRRLDLPELGSFEGVGVYYAATFMEAQPCADKDVIVVGGANSAGQAATFLAASARQVHMLIRGPDLAQSMSRYLIRRIEETRNIVLHRRTQIVALEGKEHLERVTWLDDVTGVKTIMPIRYVFSMTGASPNSRWLEGLVAMDSKGFVQTGFDLSDQTLRAAHWPLARRPYLFETSRPRVFAVGDVRANSSKRVAAAVGEGSVCIQLIHKALSE